MPPQVLLVVTADGAEAASALAAVAAVALAVSFLGFRAARRGRRAARRGRRGELLAAADESLDRLARLAAGLLDLSRLQAGKLSVFPRPAVLGDIIERAVDDVGPQSVTLRVCAGLPQVMVDPELMERVIVNLAGNALRYSPPGTPPLLAADGPRPRRPSGGAGLDRGPGIPRTRCDQAFLPFQQLGDPCQPPGVGLGLALSRGPTMVISLPAATTTVRAAVPRAGRGQTVRSRVMAGQQAELRPDREPVGHKP